MKVLVVRLDEEAERSLTSECGTRGGHEGGCAGGDECSLPSVRLMHAR